MAYVVANMKLVVVHIFPLVKPLKRNGGREKVGILFGLLMTSNLAVFQNIVLKNHHRLQIFAFLMGHKIIITLRVIFVQVVANQLVQRILH